MFHPPSLMGEPSQKLPFSAHGDIVLSSTPFPCLRLAVKVQLLSWFAGDERG